MRKAQEHGGAQPHSVRGMSNVYAGTALETVGDDITRSCVSLVAVLGLGAGALELGVLQVLPMLAMLALGVAFGRWSDRWRPSSLMALTAWIRFAVGTVVALATVTKVIDMATLMFAMAVVAAADAGYLTAQTSRLTGLVPPEAVGALFARTQAVRTAVGIACPVLLGVLLLGADAGWWLLIAAAAYLGTGVLALCGPTARWPRQHPLADAAPCDGGYRLVLTDPSLRTLTASTALFNAGVMFGSAALGLIMLRELRVEPAAYIATNSVGAAAGLLASGLSTRVTARWGVRTVRIAASLAGAGAVAIFASLS